LITIHVDFLPVTIHVKPVYKFTIVLEFEEKLNN
jgi:hypothetical protein